MSDLQTRILEVEANDDTGSLARALEAVLELHRPYEWLFRYEPITSCMHCAHISTVEHKYPCSTVRAITDALKGVD